MILVKASHAPISTSFISVDCGSWNGMMTYKAL